MRFLIAGAWNTAFGYGFYVGLLLVTKGLPVTETVHAILVLCVAQVVSVTQSFVSYKWFVFKGGEEIVREFARFSAVYAGTFAFNLAALPLLLRYTPLGPIAAQALVVVVCAACTYVIHSLFSFRQRGAQPQ